jgi:hypothetical protein
MIYRDLTRKLYGDNDWHKRKRFAKIYLPEGSFYQTEVIDRGYWDLIGRMFVFMNYVQSKYLELRENMMNNAISCSIQDVFLLSGADDSIDSMRPFSLIGVQLNEWGYCSVYDAFPHDFCPTKVVNKTIKEALHHFSFLEVPCLDAYCKSYIPIISKATSCESIYLPFSTLKKREIVTSLVLDFCTNFSEPNGHILCFGYFSYLYQALRKVGFYVDYVDNNIDGADFLKEDQRYSAVIISGSGIYDGSIFSAIDYSTRNNIPQLILSQTAGSILPLVLNQSNSMILSQEFPFWYLPGESVINCYKFY